MCLATSSLWLRPINQNPSPLQDCHQACHGIVCELHVFSHLSKLAQALANLEEMYVQVDCTSEWNSLHQICFAVSRCNDTDLIIPLCSN